MRTDDADERVVPEWELCDRMRRSLRLVPALSLAEVAEFYGVSRETVGRWINGHNKPSKVALAFWADMTGVDREWLETGQAPTSGTPGPARLYGIRDSNPEPADSKEGVTVRLTLVGSAA